jgi:hypothetical protein
MSRTVFFRLIAHAPEEVQQEVKEDARRAIAVLCFTEDDIRRQFAEEDLWDELSDDEQEEAIERLMDAWEFEPASDLARQTIAEAIARYIQDTSIDKHEHPND